MDHIESHMLRKIPLLEFRGCLTIRWIFLIIIQHQYNNKIHQYIQIQGSVLRIGFCYSQPYYIYQMYKYDSVDQGDHFRYLRTQYNF